MVNIPIETAWARARAYIDSRRHIAPLIKDKVKQLDAEGNPIMTEVWAPAPTIAGARYEVFEGIDRATWMRWKDAPEAKYHDVVCWLNLQIEAFLEQKVYTEDRPEGPKFGLINHFKDGWKESKELELGPETRATEAMTAISLREKLEMIISASDKARATLANLGDDDAGSNDDQN